MLITGLKAESRCTDRVQEEGGQKNGELWLSREQH